MRVEQPKAELPKLKDFKPAQPMQKLMVLFGLVIAATALFWLAWHNALTSVEFSFHLSNLVTIASTLLAFCLMFSVVALTEIFVTMRWYFLLVCVVAAATGLLFFGVSIWSLLAAAIMAAGWYIWRRSISNDMKTRTMFKPRQTLDTGLRSTVSIILLALSVMYFGFITDRAQSESDVINGLVDASMEAVNLGLNQFYGEGYNPDMSLDAFIANIIRIGDLEKQGLSEIEELTPDIEELDRQIKAGIAIAEQEVIAKARDEFLKSFEIEATGDERMDSVVRKVVAKNITRYVGPYEKFIPALLALSMFFLLNVFALFCRELIKIFAAILYHVLKWLHFFKVTKVQTEVEKVSL
ncbi:MAG: hypothetical protein HZC01_00575 [Candidatus Kerfeldbacteria bacterium]|nr:hypothetical protein [Candidatus Kerfeldbacteria bacterium]